MKILLAPDKFKGTLSATQVCRAMREGILHVDPSIEIDECPVADGGEGTVDAMVRAMHGRLETCRVTGPLPEMKVDAPFGIFDDAAMQCAVLEMASASGLFLLDPTERDPLATTTFGTGELINHAIELGCRRILIGLGGSATVDGGIGCAHSCGLPVLLDGGEPTSLSEPLCGRDLPSVVLIKHARGDRLGGVEFIGLCDVTNPLLGEHGAARTFGPQKGASPQVVEQLEHDLRQLVQRNGKQLESDLPGAGAAGGLGFGLAAFFGATLRRGADAVLDAVRFDERLTGVDLCLTGEGHLDATTSHGKAPSIVRQRCIRAGIPCTAIVGQAMPDATEPFAEVVSLFDQASSLDAALTNASDLVARATEQLVRRFIAKTK